MVDWGEPGLSDFEAAAVECARQKITSGIGAWMQNKAQELYESRKAAAIKNGTLQHWKELQNKRVSARA